MVNSGVDPYTALQLANNKDTISGAAVCKFRKKVNRYSLQHPSVVKAASNQVKRILSGEVRELDQQKVTKDGEVVNYVEQIAPSDTNILAAAGMVYDRYEPVRTISTNLNLSVECSPVDLDRWQNRSLGVSLGVHEAGTQDKAIDIS